MDDGGVELVCVREVEVEATAMFKPLGAQGALVKVTCGVEDESVVLEVVVTSGSKDAVWAVEGRQERRHILVGEKRCL